MNPILPRKEIETHLIPDDGRPVFLFGGEELKRWNRDSIGAFIHNEIYYVVHQSLDSRRPSFAVKGYACIGARQAEVMEEFLLPAGPLCQPGRLLY